MNNVQVTPHFKLAKLWSPDTCEIFCDKLFWAHMDKLEKLRCNLDMVLVVNSGHRSIAHNEKIGGVSKSMHLRFATDLSPRGSGKMKDRLERLNDEAERLGFSGIGRYNSFLHVDCRELVGRINARWDHRS